MSTMLCTPKRLPPELHVAAAQTAVAVNPRNAPKEAVVNALFDQVGRQVQPEHLALLTSTYWGSAGVHLTVSFLEETAPDLGTRILSNMNAWGQWCNVKFSWVASGGQVRITRSGDGYWSYLGTDVLHIPASEPTMSLQAFTMQTAESEYKRVVRHEVGHTLGFPHEHLRRQLVSRLDRARTIAWGARVLGWDEPTVVAQILTALDDSAIRATLSADQTSIMCYQLPAEITTDGQPILGGTDIDTADQVFAASVYPVAVTSVVPSRVELLQACLKGATRFSDGHGRTLIVRSGPDHGTPRGIYTLATVAGAEPVVVAAGQGNLRPIRAWIVAEIKAHGIAALPVIEEYLDQVSWLTPIQREIIDVLIDALIAGRGD